MGAPTEAWLEVSTTNSDAGVFRTLSRQALGDGFQAVYYRDEIAGLESGTKLYWCRAVAENSAGVGSSPWIEFTTEGSAPVQEPPYVDEDPATDITSDGFTANGDVNPKGSPTEAWFEISTTSFVSGIFDSSPRKAVGDGTLAVNVQAAFTGLDSDTRYYYRLVAENAAGTSASNFQSVQTEALPGAIPLGRDAGVRIQERLFTWRRHPPGRSTQNVGEAKPTE